MATRMAMGEMLRAIPAAGLALLAAAPAAAAGGSEGGGLFWPTVNFVLLLAVLIALVRKPAQAWFAERHRGIYDDLETASQLHREAEQRYADWQRRLVDLESELAGIRQTARERAETEREHILADAQKSAERIRRDATAAIDQEVRRAKDRLRQEASDLAVELAAGLLRDNVNEQDRERLLDEFIARVESAATTSHAGTGSDPS